MFVHLFITKLKVLLRNKSMLFWTLIFPFVLSTFFSLAFSNIGKAYELKDISLAIVNDENYENSEILKNIISSLSSENENKLFEVKYLDENEAKESLENGDVKAYIICDEEGPKLFIKENGIEETIIKYVFDEYYQMSSVAEQMISYNPENIYNGALELLSKDENYVVDSSTEKIDFSINYFFTLIAMTCLYGSLIGLEIIKDSEANLSTKGARVCVAPVNKIIIILSGILAGYVIQLVDIGLLFAYLIFVLKVNFGAKVLPTIILGMVGCLAGTALGTFIGVSNRKSESFKIAVLILTIMACCFLAGMMGPPEMKMALDEKLPVIASINPVNMITGGLYALFAYDTLDVYYISLTKIVIFALIMIILTFIFVRRKNYDSI